MMSTTRITQIQLLLQHFLSSGQQELEGQELDVQELGQDGVDGMDGVLHELDDGQHPLASLLFFFLGSRLPNTGAEVLSSESLS